MSKQKDGGSTGNIDERTVASFGDEWSRMDQGKLNEKEKIAIFQDYFAIFPFDSLPEHAAGYDMGCGSGRWASLVAPRVASLHCIDASPEALAVARVNLNDQTNIIYLSSSVDRLGLPDASFDFGYSLGVLHHVPDTAAAIASCARLLKPGAPFLLYLYYALEDKPGWYRMIWRASELFRAIVNKFPAPLKAFSANVLAAALYWPLAKSALLCHKIGLDVENFPLSYYRDKSFYTMRTDARDRFGTPLEKRFTRVEIETMLAAAGFVKTRFSDRRPYWVAVAHKHGHDN
jgi:ubiquinone/menaquinone biosynthesis C-methylase UbiE